MSDYIPFEIQSEIIKRFPVKSIIQFRSVSKQWKDFIDNPKFINNYHINLTNPQHRLFLSYIDGTTKTYTSIVDNNTFPQHKFPLTAPDSLSSLRGTITLGSIDGLLYFSGFYGDVYVVVIWNPTIRKSVGIVVIHKAGYKLPVVGFGVCPDTSDPKLVNISVAPNMWEIEVFTLSTRIWKPVYMGAPFKSCHLTRRPVFVDGVIYFRAYDDESLTRGSMINFVISFDLKSDKFGEVCLPERLLHAHLLTVETVNESLGLLEYYIEGEEYVCGVWSMKDGANKPFTKIYIVKVEGKSSLCGVLEFRNNGDVVVELMDDNYRESRIEVYEPLSGLTVGVGINGKRGMFSARSYMETLLLLDESDSIIGLQ